MNDKLKKGLRVSAYTLGGCAGFLVLVLCLTALMPVISYQKFYSSSEKMFKIPGIGKNYIVQGLDYVEEDKIYLLSAYNKSNNKSAAIYSLSSDYKTVKEIKLLNEDGSVYNAHAGGIAGQGKYVYIANGFKFDVFSLDEIKNASSGDSIKKSGSIPTQNNSSFAYIDPVTNIIYSGEFEKKGSQYTTLSSHHIVTSSGDENNALAIGYRIDTSYELGVDPVPVEAISIPSLAQGMCFTSRYAVISSSWGLSSSRFKFFDLEKMKVEGNILLEGSSYNVPYYVLDSSDYVKTLKAPPMSEETEYVDGKLVYISESASNKYIFGKWTGGYYARGYYTD